MLGTVIGSYQLVRKLGEGGMGAVYLGQHSLLGRRAAIKVLLPALSSRPDVVSRFFNEARAVTSISDPGIVQVFDFGYHTDGSAFIVMEFLEGEALDERLRRLGRLPVNDALRLARQVACSLAAAHAKSIVHRDLKPENIFLVRDLEVASGERSKVLDFGIAKLADDQPGQMKTSAGALMGTPTYMSPEQCRGLTELDHRSDIYALGCVMFHLLTGRPPFEGEGTGDVLAAHIREPAPAPSSGEPSIAPTVDALVLRCLAKAPADRFQSMSELAAAIGQLLPHITSPDAATHYVPSRTPVPSPPTTLGGSVGEVAPAIRGRRGWIAVVATLAIGGGAAAMWMRSRTATPPAEAETVAAPRAVDAAVPTPDAVVDAGVDAAVDAAAAIPVDAAVAVPHRRPAHPHREPVAVPSTAPSAPADSSCDRAVDTDCDGIPDVR